jgi:WD40 repeat protein
MNYESSESTDKNAHEGEVECIEWIGEGGVLATGGRDSTVKFWKVDNEFLFSLHLKSSFSFLETIAAHKSSVNALIACDKEQYLASAGRDSSINLWNTKSLMPATISKRVSIYTFQ